MYMWRACLEEAFHTNKKMLLSSKRDQPCSCKLIVVPSSKSMIPVGASPVAPTEHSLSKVVSRIGGQNTVLPAMGRYVCK